MPIRFGRLELLLAVAGACWGQSGAQVVKVVGERHKLVLKSDGTLVGWGVIDHGTLGPVAAIPAVSRRSTGLVAISLPGKAIDIAAGEDGSYALLEDGTVVEWGRYVNAGRGSETAVRVAGISNATQIVAYGRTALALLKDGTVRAWGARDFGMVGDGLHPKRWGENGPPANTAVVVPGVTGIVQIAAGSGHVLALTKDGRVLTWGSNHYGALGRAPRQELPIDSAGEVPGLTGVAAVAGGLGVSTALKKDGTVWVWGANWHAQFGFGPRTDPPGPTHGFVLTPQQTPGVAGITAISLGLTGRHTLALRKDGVVIGWGNTDWGQLGAGLSAQFQPKPTPVKLAGVKAVFAAGNNSFAVQTDGTLWMWGAGGRNEWPLAQNARLPVRLDLP